MSVRMRLRVCAHRHGCLGVWRAAAQKHVHTYAGIGKGGEGLSRPEMERWTCSVCARAHEPHEVGRPAPPLTHTGRARAHMPRRHRSRVHKHAHAHVHAQHRRAYLPTPAGPHLQAHGRATQPHRGASTCPCPMHASPPRGVEHASKPQGPSTDSVRPSIQNTPMRATCYKDKARAHASTRPNPPPPASHAVLCSST